MLDFTPPPAIYEEAPDWARTPSGLLIPTKKSALPGMTPYPGLVGASAGGGPVQVPPWPTTPTTFVASWNGTATSGTPSNTNPFTPTLNSAILVWVTTRTINPDANPQSHVVTDNQGGTYTRVGDENRFTNGGAGNSYVSQLWKRDQLSAAVSTIYSITTTTAASGLWNCGLVYEVKNPGGYPFQCEARSSQATSSGSSFTMPNEGDLFCMDFCSGGGATSTISATSGFTKLYEAATYVSSNLRFTILASALQAQKAGRTYSFTTFESVTSAAMWFDGPKRSKPAIEMQYLGNYSRNQSSSFTITGATLGTPADDRMIHVLVMPVITVAITATFTPSGVTPILPWQNFLPALSSRSPRYLYSALVPTGTTMDIALTSSQASYWAVHIWASYGQGRLGPNQEGLVLGDATTPRNASIVAANGPLSLSGVVVPANSILLGGCNCWSGSATSAGAWTTDGTNPSNGGGGGFGARLDNIANASDLLAQTVSATFSGGNNAGICAEVFGP